MRKVIMTVIQMVIFTGTWFIVTNQIENSTWIFGFGDIETFKENTQWILLGAACLSVVNIWVWWPKKVKVASTPETTKGDKSTEAKTIDEDPKTPTLD